MYEHLPQPRGRRFFIEQERGVTDVRVEVGLAHVRVRAGSGERGLQNHLRILDAIAEQGVSVSLVKLHHDWITFAVNQADVAKVAQCLEALGIEYKIASDLALVVTVAANMRDSAGIMAQIAEALWEAGAHIIETGDSHDTVQCLVPEERAFAAAQALRRRFFAGGVAS
ncbi:MAG: ACT domain-containing protein [Armatimonadetes bacterium]|nr:ACT domain-containing protein [Armatimonadota bacterium]